MPAPSEQPGLYYAGQILSIKAGKSWTGSKDGITRNPFDVNILVGDRVQRVQFDSEAAAKAAVGDLVGKHGAVKCWARGQIVNGQARVFFSGERLDAPSA